MLFEPGTYFEYSSYGWILVSAAVEAAAGEPFLTFMREQIFEPLGMTGTVADSSTEPSADNVSYAKTHMMAVRIAKGFAK